MIIAVTAIITAITKVIVDFKGLIAVIALVSGIVLGEYITNISKYLFTARTYYLNRGIFREINIIYATYHFCC